MIWTYAAAALLALAVGFSGGWKVRSWKAGNDDAARIAAEQLERDRAVIRADKAADGHAARTEAIRAEVRTITREVERVVSQPVYIDRPCLDADGLRLVARAAGAPDDPGISAPAVPASAAAP